MGRVLETVALALALWGLSGCRTAKPAHLAQGRAVADPSRGAPVQKGVRPAFSSRWLLYGTRPWGQSSSGFSERVVRVGEKGVEVEIPLPAQAAWSPSGELLRVCNVPALGKGLSLMTVAGNALSRPRYVGLGCGGWWAPRGGHAVTPDGAQWVIGDLTGAGSMRRFQPPLQFAEEPRWSPTGLYLWTRSVWGAEPRAHWLSVTSDSPSLEPLRAADWDAWPSCSWSAEGEQLACRGHRLGSDQQGLLLFTAHRASATPQGRLLAQVGPLPGGRFVSGLESPSWAGPDWIVLGGSARSVKDPGREVRFPGEPVPARQHSVLAYSHEGGLHLAELDSGADITLPERRFGPAPVISWSPDGSHLLLHSRDPTGTAIWLLPGARTLTTTPRLIAVTTPTNAAVRAAFTPGSTWVWHERAIRAPAGCDPPCELEWVAATAHHIATGQETQFSAQDGVQGWTEDDLLLVERAPGKGSAPSQLVVRRARQSMLEAVARIDHAGQLRFSWQP